MLPGAHKIDIGLFSCSVNVLERSLTRWMSGTEKVTDGEGFRPLHPAR